MLPIVGYLFISSIIIPVTGRTDGKRFLITNVKDHVQIINMRNYNI